jgi:hypothetical protein
MHLLRNFRNVAYTKTRKSMYVIIIVNLISHTDGHVVGRPAGRVLRNFIDGVL